MEFFTFVDIETESEILQTLKMEKLDQYCSEIDCVLDITHEHRAEIYCLWGQFTLQRQLINGGVRYSMPQCPNALAWTITTGLAPEPQKVVIHCTINKTEHDADFIESIQTFIQAWKIGLEQHLI